MEHEKKDSKQRFFERISCHLRQILDRWSAQSTKENRSPLTYVQAIHFHRKATSISSYSSSSMHGDCLWIVKVFVAQCWTSIRRYLQIIEFRLILSHVKGKVSAKTTKTPVFVGGRSNTPYDHFTWGRFLWQKQGSPLKIRGLTADTVDYCRDKDNVVLQLFLWLFSICVMNLNISQTVQVRVGVHWSYLQQLMIMDMRYSNSIQHLKMSNSMKQMKIGDTIKSQEGERGRRKVIEYAVK